MPLGTVADVWGALAFAADACKAGYRSVMSMSRAANISMGEKGTGWYLPPYGGVDGGIWPGTWQRDLDSELQSRGCDKHGRDTLVMGGERRCPSEFLQSMQMVQCIAPSLAHDE